MSVYHCTLRHKHYTFRDLKTILAKAGPPRSGDTLAGLEDHFCGKLLGVPMGCDVCYTNHAEADQDDMDNLLTLLAVAGCNYFMGVPGADDVMLNYQSSSFHDSHYLRQLLGLRPAPEFEQWLEDMQILTPENRLLPISRQHRLIGADGSDEVIRR